MTVELHFGYNIRVWGGGNCVFASPLSRAPDFHRIVHAPGAEHVPVRSEICAQDVLQIALMEHHAATGPEIPGATRRPPKRFPVLGGSERPIAVERNVMNRFQVSKRSRRPKVGYILETIV